MIFNDGHTYMVDVENDVFVVAASYASGAALPPYGSQFTGSVLNYASSNCPDLFLNAFGAQYCPALCLNTCPQLNPNLGSVAATQQQINATNIVINSLNKAISAAGSALSDQTAPVHISGLATFIPPAGTTQSSLDSASTFIATTLVQGFGYSMNASCSGTTSALTCSFNAKIPTAEVSVYSSSLSAPYIFTSGLLIQMFDPIVQIEFSLLAARVAVSTLNTTLANNNLFAVAVTVPARFLIALGTPPPMNSIASAISTSTGLPTQNIVDAWVAGSPTANAGTFIVFGSPTGGITGNTVQNAIISASPVFTVSSIPIYVSGTDTVQVSLTALGANVISSFHDLF